MLYTIIDKIKKRYPWIPKEGTAYTQNYNNLNNYLSIKDNGLKNGDKIIIA